ncbi:MAG: hypothetical protein QM495_00285 [Lutibacter sp.]|uniref:hypothetical protein n=1 Tax=Lutibacter sp. TaxID=1925666 RepID=UPI00385E3DC3
MKNSFKLLLTTAIIATITISCGETTKKKQEKHNSEKKETVETVDNHENGGEIQLNEGKLWLANYETTKGVLNMQKLLNTFSGGESLEAYATLKSDLEKEFGTIITECTMKGESHNQLHNFLVPLKELFNGLGSSDLATCKKSFETLNKHLAAYSTYFE